MSEKTMEELLDEKIKIALNLIRTNLQDKEALNFTQGVLNLSHSKEILIPGKPTPRTKATGT